MLKMIRLLIASLTLLPLVLTAQSTTTVLKQAPVIPMPQDRVADSYLIYSSLMPLGETAGKDWPHEFWLVEDATVAPVPPGEPCTRGGTLNPHETVQPTADRIQDYQEILKDFDAHCHERLALRAEGWKTSLPVHLLTPKEQQEFRDTRFGESPAAKAAAAKYKGAPALYSFSQVYFNAHHTVALVYATHWCGSLCGQGFWVAFALENGHWKSLRWGSASWIS